MSELKNLTKNLINVYGNLEEKIMPEKAEIIQILEDIRVLLFPNHFGMPKINNENAESIVGARIYKLKAELEKQLCLAYGCTKADNTCSCTKPNEIVTAFIEELPKIREDLDNDVIATLNGDPAAESIDQIIFSYPGIFAISVYRIAHFFFKNKVPMIPRIMTEYAHSITGIDIHPGATIGKYFFIDHGTGIVIGETTTIGNNVKIYQGVTLGALSIKNRDATLGKKRHPTICDNVTIYSGVSILGGDTIIGENSIIGGNAFITTSIPANTKVSAEMPKLTLGTRKPN